MVKNRTEIDEKYTWDLSTIFPSDEAWEAELSEIMVALEEASRFEGTLAQSGHALLEVTEAYLALARRIDTLYVYGHMKNDQDTREAKYQEFNAKGKTAYAKLSQVFAFYEPELLALSEETFNQFVKEEPGLEAYAHYFDRLFQNKPHVLSKAEEGILAAASEVFSAGPETFSILNNADLKFPTIRDENGKEVQLSHGNYITFMQSKDREVRKRAYEAMYSVYEQFQHVFAKTLQTAVKTHNLNASVRHYGSAREAALSRNFVPEAVYDTLVSAVNKHLPLMHRYIKLRKKVMGIDDLKMYDLYTLLGESEPSFSYEDALAKAEEALAILGEDYLGRVKKAFSERWIDVHENTGKRSGAYSGGAYDTNAFMLLNWQDNLNNLYTLVHETGHSMHSAYTRANQPYVYGDYSIFLAEIASTTNENLLTEHLLNEVDDDASRFAILNHYLDGFRGTIFRQTQFAEFELAIHQADQAGEVLTSEYMNALYADLNAKYYGLSKEDNPQIQYEWARIPHFYYNYYVFQYSTGFAAATALAEKIINGSQEDKDKYIAYLSAGSSDYPINVMQTAGVDMTSEDYLNAAFEVFERRLEELETLAEKLYA
ncbi:oligoendopeptidase F [Streptococcus moroccensis]|uniref:Oligoendopeptidase F n=1 Tax=Streptococcus moroccensis TaxID=1451356 RepID=A0ABT9YQ83_9STRE|nr:oligoendopeptidase F [Streptococcus moroccensis]MDQ0222147.1 oligoendopeptidase F [Streptococcus moroccensis]